MKTLIILLSILTLVGCGTVRPQQSENDYKDEDLVRISRIVTEAYRTVPDPAGPPMSVAVYSFKDLTGQRKPSTTISSFSTAVTQGAESYLIKSLQEIGNRQWFKVVERVGLDNLLKERQMIKQTREIYEGDRAKPLPPLSLAGVIIEGAIVDYNSNTHTGGSGARIFGLGPYTQYTRDLVVISLRLVSVSNGEVLTSVTVEKDLISTSDGFTGIKFFNQSTQAFEIDIGRTYNEPGNYALRTAIEAAIVELIYQGERIGLWKFKQ